MLLEILQGSKWDSFARQISPVTAVLIGLVSLAPILQYLVARYHSTSRRTKILAANAPQAPHWAPLGKNVSKAILTEEVIFIIRAN